ncbi:MAG TPA: VCBS repeat-containing protein [Gemmatimonadales bacterium]|nr:VCBS repeat-containing protein [Gemmatimonadales bacterium]
MGLLCALAAGAAPAAMAQQPTPFPKFTQQVDATARLAAFDSAGARLAHPFLGGLDHPRPQLVDVDGDGDLDLVLQEYTGRLTFLENTGTQRAPAFTWRTDRWLGLDVGEWSRFVDVDGDGDLDLLAESPYSYLRLFRNDGSRRAAKYVVAADTVVDDRGRPVFSDRQNIPQLVDVDCNGKLDLLLGRASGMVTRYEATSPAGPGMPVFAFVTDSFQGLQIIGGTGFNGPQSAPMPMPSTVPGAVRPNVPTRHGANTMIVTDLDQDGDPDILWGDYFEPGLLWLVNTGTCQRPVIGRDSVQFPANAPLRTSGYNAPAVADLDGDGDLDALVGALGGAYNPDRTSRANLYYLEQTAKGAWTLRTDRFLPSIDVGSESSPALTDLDGDGDLDLVIGAKIRPDDPRSGAVYVWENRGTRTAPAWHAAGTLPMRGRYHYVPAFGDLDGDGKPDLVLGDYTAELAWWRNAGSAASPRWELADSALVALTRGSYATPALVDIDGDGDLDLFAGESSGELNFWRNEGTRAAPRFVLVSDRFDEIRVGRRSAPAFADLDGDGDFDLVVGTEAGPPVVYRNTGTRQVPAFVVDSSLTFDLPPLSAPAFADVDGDGDPDLVAGTASGGVVLWVNGATAGAKRPAR